MITKLLKITGRVQGVGYRDWMRDHAVSLELQGWVRNRADGSVEALISGPSENIENMVSACWNGPSFANVSNILDEDAPAPEQAEFKKLPTL